MDSLRISNRDCFPINPALLLVALIAVSVAMPSVAPAQVRTKKPDRGVYQPPRLSDLNTQPATSPAQPATSRVSNRDQPGSDALNRDEADRDRSLSAGATSEDFTQGKSFHGNSKSGQVGLADLVRSRDPVVPVSRPRRELVEVELVDAVAEIRRLKRLSPAPDAEEANASRLQRDAPRLQQVDHEHVILVRPEQQIVGQATIVGQETVVDPVQDEWTHEMHGTTWGHGEIIHDGTCDGCPDCDLNSCDSIGCDSMGCCGTPWYRKWANSSVSLDRGRWFGGVELLLMFRNGDRLPPLVTTSTDADPDPDTAGEIGQAGTQVLAGDDTVLKDLRAGGRLTLGTWIDRQQCRSLVMRGWFADQETFSFSANGEQIPVITRPFLNVSDDQAAAPDTQLVAFPDRVSGSIGVRASSDVFGGDVSVRQFWYGRYGGSVDFLYGYQYMRLDEDLAVSSTSTSLDDDFAPLGSVLAISDTFDIDNEFHGGQFGVATRYREGCWSFDGLLKFGFGSLRRRARLQGTTLTSVDGANATDPNGLLVRSTNAGTTSDDTFGWVPELDVSLGWQRYPCFDVTVGYHIIAMTDALQVSGAIDPELAVNLSSPPTGQQRPAAALAYDTFYVQGIHFGLQYIH